MCSRTAMRGANLTAAALALLVALAPTDLWSQQLGRQKDLTPAQLQTLHDQIAELGGRAIIGFKPAGATQGMRADGTPALAPSVVRDLAASLAPLGVSVQRQFRIIPAVGARIDPARLPELLGNPAVDYVEPDYQIELHAPAARSERPLSPAQSIPWGITRVDAASAWPTTKGGGVKVGILDTGMDYDHPDLNPAGGINVVTGGTSTSDWDDNSAYCPTHGTHVSGTVAALDNTIGVVGVAPEVEIYAVRIFDPENSGVAPLCVTWGTLEIAGIEWAVDNDMDVINLSIGGSYPEISVGDAFFAAFMAGVIPVASSGNDAGPVSFPGAFPYAIAVGATDDTDAPAYFSNYGPELDVAAPGVSVLSSVGGGGYEYWDGTSMAAPHVTGTVALIRAARPDLDPEDVRQILYSTATDIYTTGYDFYTGWGIVQAGAGVDAVASTSTALSFAPGDMTLAVEPSASPVTETVELRNVGAAGTISWTAAADATWIELDPTSGSVTDVTPGSIDITANPSGLSVGSYTGFVTLSGNAANTPAQIRVRLSVAERIPLDASVATAGYVPYGQRLRYLLAGTAGQQIDVAVLTDESQATPLYDPTLRVYLPDGETMMAFNDDALDVGLDYQSLLYSLTLPEDGDYIVEVGGYGDYTEGAFLLKARPTGPILAVLPALSVSDRAEQDGTPAATEILVYNLTGVGNTSWSVDCPDPWITCSPSSGTLTVSGQPVGRRDLGLPAAARHPLPAGRTPPRTDNLRREMQNRLFPGQRISEEKLSKSSLETLAPPPRTPKPKPSQEPQASAVTLTMDPGGLPLTWNYGALTLESADGWLPALEMLVQFWVYSPGMAIAGDESGYEYPWDVATDDTRPGDPPVLGTTVNDDGSLVPVLSDATVGSPVVSGLGEPVGVTVAADASWYVSEWGISEIAKIARDGTPSSFATMPDNDFAAWLAWGPNGEVYATPWYAYNVFKINPDGSVEDFGPSLYDYGTGLAYRPQDNSLYVGLWNGPGVMVIPLDDPSSAYPVASNVYATAVAIGQSGTVYLADWDAVLWSLDPEGSSDATMLAVTPAYYSTMGAALDEGGLVVSDYDFWEFYRFQLDDDPIPYPAETEASYTAYLDVEQIDAVQGEPFDVPLVLESVDGSDLPVAAYQCQVNWQPTELDYTGHQAGDFGGTFVPNADDADQGIFLAAAARATNVEVPSTDLFALTWDLQLEPGECTDVALQFSELSGEGGENLLSQLEVVSPASIGMSEGMGDVTGNGTIEAADAVQILRWLVGLPLCEGCDINRGDANCDGEIQAADAVVILRWLVALPVEGSCVGVPRIGPCPQ